MKHLCSFLVLIVVLLGLEAGAALPADPTMAAGSEAMAAPVMRQTAPRGYPAAQTPESPRGTPFVSLTGARSQSIQDQHPEAPTGYPRQEQVAKLVAADGAWQDTFGVSVSVDGDTALVGAVYVNITALDQGAAYVFDRDQGGPNQWGQVARLLADDAGEDEHFGRSVSLDGDTAVVSAPGVYPGGAAYVFYRHPGGLYGWEQVAKLTADDGAHSDAFGCSVAVSGDVAVVGAWYADIGGNPNQGAAYVFYRNEGGPDAWGQVAKLIAADGGNSDWFGGSVAVSGDTVVVGAENHPLPSNQGAAYVFYRDQGGPDAWGQVAELTAGNGDQFGESVSVDGDTAVVGAPFVDVGGAAYVFSRNQGGPDAWGQVAKLVASDGASYDLLGWSVSLDGDVAIVGAQRDDVGGPFDDQGSAYLFYRDLGGPDQWGQMAKLVADDGAEDDWFGTSVALSGDAAVVGAERADVGLNEDQGAAYVFTWPSLHLKALFLAPFPGPWPGTPGTRWVLLALARVHDGEDAPASSVTVSGEWTLPGGQVRAKEAVTGPGGLARFLTLSGQTGTHQFCVTDLAKEGYLYNPGGDEVPACQSVEVGP